MFIDSFRLEIAIASTELVSLFQIRQQCIAMVDLSYGSSLSLALLRYCNAAETLLCNTLLVFGRSGAVLKLE